jgi:hypothetical protein
MSMVPMAQALLGGRGGTGSPHGDRSVRSTPAPGLTRTPGPGPSRSRGLTPDPGTGRTAPNTHSRR